MRCKGTTKKGTQCRKTVLIDSEYCAQHDTQEPEVVGEVVEEVVEEAIPCASCGPAKAAVQSISVADLEVPLCMSCLIGVMRTILELIGVEDVDGELLEFRESL